MHFPGATCALEVEKSGFAGGVEPLIGLLHPILGSQTEEVLTNLVSSQVVDWIRWATIGELIRACFVVDGLNRYNLQDSKIWSLFF